MISMALPRIAINTAMFAATVRVDRPIKGNIGRCIARDDRFGMFGDNGGAQAWCAAINIDAIIKPIAVGYPFRQPKPRRHKIGRRTAAGNERQD